VRKYGLTPDQVEEAVKRGLITDCKLGDDGELRINEEELVAKLEEIKRLPPLSEERRRLLEERMKLLEAASTTCPLCGRTVRPRKRTLTRRALYEGRVTVEEARIVAVVTHFRHAHTDYDRVRRDPSALANFLEPREGGLMFGSLKAYLSLRELSSRKAQREAEKALARYRELKQKAVESAKRVFTGEAIEKAKQRGLLPQDLTLEEYARIAKRVLRSRALEARASYTSLNQSYTLFMRSYKLLSDELERQRDELNTCRLAGLAALGLAVTAAALAVEGWRKALSLAKEVGSIKES
jgi:hypothetical protein